MAKPDKKAGAKRKAAPKKKKAVPERTGKERTGKKRVVRARAPKAKRAALGLPPPLPPAPPLALGASSTVLDRLWGVVTARRTADPTVSHSARLLARGTAKVAQKFGEEAVECLIEAVAGNTDALVGESADVLYHLLVLWVDAGIRPEQVWAELQRREGISGIAEKASRARALPSAFGVNTTKIP